MNIYKYELPEEPGVFFLELPKGAEVLSVANQHDQACMWAAVDNEAVKERRGFAVVMTGGEPPKNGRFLGTVLLLGGVRVHHIFEVV